VVQAGCSSVVPIVPATWKAETGSDEPRSFRPAWATMKSHLKKGKKKKKYMLLDNKNIEKKKTVFFYMSQTQKS
jgi:hypothetical protein